MTNLHETHHETLDDALKHILADTYGHDYVERATDDDGNIVPGYVTSYSNSSGSDPVMWTYEGGLESPGGNDHTRLMDPCEVICEPEHLRYHFGDQIDEFERGEHYGLAFVFATVDAYPPDDVEPLAIENGTWDATVGYIYELYIYN